MNWLLLRGLAREQRHWGEFPEILKKEHPGSQIACLDLPGTGTENKRPSPLTVNTIVADLRERWLTTLPGLSNVSKEPWGLIGISLGGMAGLHWSHQHPDDFARLVLINSSAGNLNHPFDRIRPSALGGGLKSLFSSDMTAKELQILQMTTRLKAAELSSIAVTWAELARSHPIQPQTVLSQILAASLFRAPHSVSVPLLVVSASRDHFTSPKCSKAFAAHFRAPMVTHPQAGHDLPLDDPKWLALEIHRWMSMHPNHHAHYLK